MRQASAVMLVIGQMAISYTSLAELSLRFGYGDSRVIMTKTTLFLGFIALSVFCLSSVEAQYDDWRCKCVCPSPEVVTNETEPTKRKLYIGNVPPLRCNCDYVVLPKLGSEVQEKAKEFCPRCECKYESRNTKTIRWVVIFIIGIISFLFVYMGFLMLLDPLLHKSGARQAYHEHVNEEVSMDEQIVSEGEGRRRRATTPITSPSSSGPPPRNVLNRVGQQQNKWKKQVQEQRRNIYDKHTMLN